MNSVTENCNPALVSFIREEQAWYDIGINKVFVIKISEGSPDPLNQCAIFLERGASASPFAAVRRHRESASHRRQSHHSTRRLDM